MGKRRQKSSRRTRSSSADIRFTFLMIGLGAVVVLIGGLLVGQARAADWTAAAISGALIIALVAIAIYSGMQRRRR